MFAMEKLVTHNISRCLKIVIVSRVSDAHEDRLPPGGTNSEHSYHPTRPLINSKRWWIPNILNDFKNWIWMHTCRILIHKVLLGFSVPKLILHDPICYQLTWIIKCARKDCRLPTGGVEWLHWDKQWTFIAFRPSSEPVLWTSSCAS